MNQHDMFQQMRSALSELDSRLQESLIAGDRESAPTEYYRRLATVALSQVELREAYNRLKTEICRKKRHAKVTVTYSVLFTDISGSEQDKTATNIIFRHSECQGKEHFEAKIED